MKNDKKKVLILMLILMASFSGCTKKEVNNDECDNEYDYHIYCTDATNTYLDTWGYDMPGEVSDKDLITIVDDIMSVYESNPTDDSKKSAIPAKLNQIDYYVESNVLNVKLDESFNTLYSLEKLFFKASLVLTFTQIEGIDYVYITVNGQPLTDENGVNIRYLTRESFITYDDGLRTEASEFYGCIYFANDSGDKLVETNDVYSYDRSVSPEMFVLELLQAGDNGNMSASPTLPKESVVNNAYTKNGICYVDFNEKINDKGFVGIKADTMLYAVVNSLSELNNVTGVKISINGKDDVLFRGEIGIEGIFHMNLDIIE